VGNILYLIFIALGTGIFATLFGHRMFFVAEDLYGCKKAMPENFYRKDLISVEVGVLLNVLFSFAILYFLSVSYNLSLFAFMIPIILLLGFVFSMALFDAKYLIIPNFMIISLAIISIAIVLCAAFPNYYSGREFIAYKMLADSFLGVAFGLGFPWFINLFNSEKIGAGDIKMFGAMGILTGGSYIVILMIIAWALQIAAFMIFIDKGKRSKASLCLAPFAAVAFIATLIIMLA